MKKVLLVGGAGYIGSVVCEELLSRGISVHSIDKFIYENNHSVLPFIGKKGFSFTYGDMRDRNFIESVFVGITDVVILAGLVGDPITKKYPLVAHAINDVGVMTIIDACTNKNINSVIFVSTCSNYGLINDNELADENFELKPLSLYAQSIVQAE